MKYLVAAHKGEQVKHLFVIALFAVLVPAWSNARTTSVTVTETVAARKAVDESLSNSIALQDDDDLQFAVAANGEYLATATLYLVNVGTVYSPVSTYGLAPGAKLTFDGPAGSSCFVKYIAATETEWSGAVVVRTSSSPGAVAEWSPTHIFALDATVNVSMWFKNDQNAGTVKLRWAQHTSQTASLTMRAGSVLTAHRIN